MPEVDVEVGGRIFKVACQEGEEHFLQSAAKMLDAEAETLADQIGRMPEQKMLLMAGLMLADKTAGLEEDVRKLKAAAEGMRADLDAATSAEPNRIEVAVIPPVVHDSFAEIAARAEALAARFEG